VRTTFYADFAESSAAGRIALRFATILPKTTEETIVASHKGPNREYLQTLYRGDCRLPVGRPGDGGQSRRRRLHRVIDSREHGRVYERLLLSAADALSDLHALRRLMRAVLSPADALPELSALRWLMRAVLSAADALSLPADRAARFMRYAPMLRRGPVAYSPVRNIASRFSGELFHDTATSERFGRKSRGGDELPAERQETKTGVAPPPCE
jgi:hypothetical protein